MSDPHLSATRGQRYALLAGLVVAVYLMLSLFASVLLPFVAAACIAYFLDPLASRLVRLGLPRSIAAAVMIVAMLTGMLLFALLFYPLLVAQIGILISRAPDYTTELRAFANLQIAKLQDALGPQVVDEKLRDLVGGQAGEIVSFVAGTLRSIVGSGFAIFNVATLVVVTPVVGFYFLRDWQAMIGRIDSWLPRRYAGVLRAQAHEVDRILSAWLRGQAMCCVVLALYYALALSLVGLDLGLLVGLMAGFLSFIPYVGSITGLIAAISLAFAQFPTWTGVIEVGCVFAVGQFLEGYVIYPRFLGDRVELHAVWVIFALFAGGAAFGFVGVLLAVPVTASYIICAVIAAPALINLGVPDFAAHMFIFYYAVLSEVSPPTALSPFAAAAICKGSPYKTTLQTWKYVAPAILVPFMFVLDKSGTSLLLMGSMKALMQADWLQIAWITFTAIMGIVCLAGGLQGWFIEKTNLFERVVMVIAGVALAYPDTSADMVGFVGFAIVLATQILRHKKLNPKLVS